MAGGDGRILAEGKGGVEEVKRNPEEPIEQLREGLAFVEELLARVGSVPSLLRSAACYHRKIADKLTAMAGGGEYSETCAASHSPAPLPVRMEGQRDG